MTVPALVECRAPQASLCSARPCGRPAQYSEHTPYMYTTVGAESVYRAKSLYRFSAAAVFTPYH